MAFLNDSKQLEEIDELKKQEEEEAMQALSDTYNLPYIDLRGLSPEPDAMQFITEEEARDALVAPFKLIGKKLYLATPSPTRPELEKLLRPMEEKGEELVLFLCSHSSLDHVLSRYKDFSHGDKVEGGMLDLSEKKMAALMAQFGKRDELQKVFDEMSHSQILYKTTRILELMMAGALKLKASDIHIEPEETKVRLRYRVNGALEDIAFFDFALLKNITSRLKLLAGLKLSTVASAQDGRFSIDLGEVEVDMRVSVVPGNYGESFVMRILDPRNTVKNLDGIAFGDKVREAVTMALARPNGILLTTGPTGSGKTTTLYAFLNHVYTSEVKILTIEDPIEYHFEGITQTQVEEEKNYTFLSGLRAALRQDPDVIMVGEIRDEDTAKVAINAALTGHLVLSTLHTNNAAGTFPRLIDLGVNPKVIAGALSLSLAQRLVRKLCNECKDVYESSEKESRVITNILGEMKLAKKEDSMGDIVLGVTYPLFRSHGCEHCSGTGYSGRIGIFEAVIMNAEIETALMTNPSEREIKKAARSQRIPTLREDAILKALTGQTSFEEISKTVDLYGDE
ncbi:MAG: type II/IV secretion system protein [Candidatus Pacebacteria bacterium]|nr:type II/IV secretion system protein [Candidatus Paceibacterota bacterium]